MIHHQQIQCPHCGGNDLQKNGKSGDVTQRRFKGSKKYFRLEYRYNAYRQGVKEKIIEKTLNIS
jgi:transposase-like protein